MADEVAQVIDAPSMNYIVLTMQQSLKQNRDIRGGREKILASKSDYINQLEEQTDEQFASMAEMAPIYVLYPRVVDGFVGTIFQKKPNLTGIEFTDEQKDMNKNVDLLGNSIDKYSENVVSQVMENGFCASLNDYSPILNRPFVRMINPEDFISFRHNSDDGYPKVSQFIFCDIIEVDDPEDEFSTLTKNQYTVLDLAENPDNNNKKNYRIRIYESTEERDILNTNEKVIFKSVNFPKKDSEFFDDIPLEIHGVENSNLTISKSLLQDISDMNISVIQRTVDQVYMLHWTALPTPWVSGAEDKDSVTTIGPTKVWHIENPEAKVGLLEFTGSSARAHQDFIDNLLYLMAVMGAQILKKEGVSRETATSVLVRTAQQTSLVSTMVENSSGQLEKVFGTYFDWAKIIKSAEYAYKLNKDFIKADMEPNAQIALVKSWLDGCISHESVFEKMKEGEIVNSNLTFEQEKERIKANPPPFFDKEVDAENAKALQVEIAKHNQVTNDLSGSNLENENIANKQATEQV